MGKVQISTQNSILFINRLECFKLGLDLDNKVGKKTILICVYIPSFLGSRVSQGVQFAPGSLGGRQYPMKSHISVQHRMILNAKDV